MSTLSSLGNTIYPLDIAKFVQEKTIQLMYKGINITFSWVPGHANIEMADKVAKDVAQPINIQLLDILTCFGIKIHIKNLFQIKWQIH